VVSGGVQEECSYSTIPKPMNETPTNFRKAVADSTDLQEKVKSDADLVALGKENGYELDVVAGGRADSPTC